MSETRKWVEVYAQEASDFAVGKRVTAMYDTGLGMVTEYDDGSAMRVWFDEGYPLSEVTWESGRLIIEIASVPPTEEA